MAFMQLIYTSISNGETAPIALAVLERAAVFNLSRQISGLLAVDRVSFAQALEGPTAAVQDLMSRIERDPRHSRVRIVSTHQASARMWPHWQMALAAATPRNTAIFKRYGLEDGGPKRLADLDPTLLKALLMELSEHATNRSAGGSVQ